MAEQEPNHFALSGHGLQVIYASTSFAGQPQLTYQDPQRSLQFSGGDIQKADSDAGTLITVTIVRTVDTGSTSFSVLIPRVTLQNGQPAHVRTIGITAVHRLTVDTPAHGQLDTYQVAHLSGTASFLVF
jgi:hypothetical protein